MGQPLVFPHGVTVYNPEKCWSGYTIVPLINDGVLLPILTIFVWHLSLILESI